MKQLLLLITLPAVLFWASCTTQKNPEEKTNTVMKEGTFAWDKQFLEEKLNNVITLTSEDSSAMLLLVPAYQGRVMTSTSGGPGGSSYGWINY
ncbi:MAG: hypothetical protein OEY51_01265, partial [Cyclobacteriaceae bacterium]|nr:hypothetical protein [Cyclobacteriaceae bacterium]